MRFCDYDDELSDSVIALLAKHTLKQYDQRRSLWDWLYKENPFIGKGKRGVVLVDGELVVGFNGLIPVRLLRNGAQVDAAWSFDTILPRISAGRDTVVNLSI